MTLEHATCVWLGTAAVLLRGASGAGKSDLALRLIEAGGVLVADDYVAVTDEAGTLVARPPDRLRGLIEVRGVGLVRMAYRRHAPVKLAIDLVPPGDVERLPDATRTDIAGVAVPLIRLDPFETSAVVKVRLALGRSMAAGSMTTGPMGD